MVAALCRTPKLRAITCRIGAAGTQERLILPHAARTLRVTPQLRIYATWGGGLPTSPGFTPATTEARGSLDPRHCWSLWINGRWPYLKNRPLEVATLQYPPFVGVVCGVWTLHLSAVCRSLPAPSRAPGRIPCVRTGVEELSGGNWMVVIVPPVRRGCRCDRAPRAPQPFNNILPLRGSGPSGLRAARRGAPGRLAMKLPG